MIRNSFTFILITKNRFDIIQNIKSFLNLRKYIDVKIIIVDGNKSNRLADNITNVFKKEKNITIIKQRKGKFVRACLIGLDNLNTEFFTFAYDDDFLSPDFYKLINYAHKFKTTVIGNGIVKTKNSQIFNFEKLSEPKKIPSDKLLKMYFNSIKIKGKYLPASPACSVFKKGIIEDWKYELKKILKERIKYYYILNKNIGQDLLLYLISCNRNKYIYYFKEYTAQFTSHDNSMSVQFGSENLAVGYWLTKMHYLKKTRYNFNLISYTIIKINLMTRGIKIIINQINNSKSFSRHSSFKIIKVLFKTIFIN